MMKRVLQGLSAGMAVLALLGASAAPARAAGFDLVTPAEAQQAAQAEKTLPAPVRTRSLPKAGAPAITVLSPATAGRPVPAPLRIELVFQPAAGARIVPSSFRVLYGLLKLDLTERLRPHATVTEGGVVVDGAKVPEGQHRMFIQVADDKGNTAEQELRFRVGGAP